MDRIKIPPIVPKMEITGITYIQAKDQPDWSFGLHSHKDMTELSLVLNGCGTVYHAGREYTVKEGDMVIKNPELLHSERSDPSAPIEQICMSIINVRREGFKPNCLISDDANPIINTGDSFEILAGLFRYALQLYQKHQKRSETVLEDVTRAIISITELLLPDSPEEQELIAEKTVIHDVIHYLNQNYAQNITLEELAKRFYFSTFHLARKFKAETGYTINQYLINCRIGEAERMLVFEDMSIKEIAGATGYSNIQHFYAAFKKYTGCTPTEFKRMYAESRRRNQ